MCALGFLAQCSGSSDAPPVFGGQGAQVSANETPLAEGQGEVAGGPCSEPAPVDSNTMLEDFEDGDNHLFKLFERDGWWFTATDDTPGTVEPPRDQFRPTLLPEGEATADNRYAAHFVASGYTDWGVVWGVTLEWRHEGVGCPLNGSAFTGVRLRAKGSGRVRVNFGIPETFPVDNRGRCKQGCYDTHGKLLELTPEWREYVVSFDKLQQGGWGTQARFDPARLLALNFNVGPDALPVDFWIDDLQWLGAETPTSSAPTPSAASTANASPAPASTAVPPTTGAH